MADVDAVRAMREQVDAAHASAQRLVEEAEAAARARAAEAPPHGWAGPSEPPESSAADEALRSVLALIELLRASVPPELSAQMAGAARDLLVAIRAIVDVALDRLEAIGEAAEAAAAPTPDAVPSNPT